MTIKEECIHDLRRRLNMAEKRANHFKMKYLREVRARKKEKPVIKQIGSWQV